MVTKKKASKKTVKKKGVAKKKAPAKKVAAKKVTQKTTQKAAKKVTRKVVAKKAAPKKTAAPKKKVAPKRTPAKKAAKKADNGKSRAAAVKKAANGARDTLKKALTPGKSKLTAADRRALKKALQEVRDRVVDEINFLSGDNLNLSQRDASGESNQGTDNFDREFALNLVSSEQDILYEIDEAMQRLEDKSYGMCQQCGCMIEKARLEALPFARMCIKCKSELEKGRTRYRPFGPTITKN